MTAGNNDTGSGKKRPLEASNAVTSATAQLREELVRFTRALERNGVSLPANASVSAARALAEVGLADRERVRNALRAALLSTPEDFETFEALFGRFWSQLESIGSPIEDDKADEPTGGLEPPTLETATGSDSTDADGDETLDSGGVRRGITDREATDAGDDVSSATYSPVGQSEQVQPTASVGDETATEAATRRLTRALATASGRRTEPERRGRQLDVRRSMRRSIVTGGAPMSLPTRQFSPTEPRGVVFVDVSRSVLDVIDRAFLVQFLRALRRQWRSLRVFLFDTDLQEVTDALDAETTADAYAALERAETEWGGGTRIGGALTAVRENYPDAVDRRTVGLVISDGLEMGDLSELEDGIVWLSRHAPLVLWLNPLAASPSFEPTASGMETVTPYVDGLFGFTDPDDIMELARQLEQYTGTEPLGYTQRSVNTP